MQSLVELCTVALIDRALALGQSQGFPLSHLSDWGIAPCFKLLSLPVIHLSQDLGCSFLSLGYLDPPAAQLPPKNRPQTHPTHGPYCLPQYLGKHIVYPRSLVPGAFNSLRKPDCVFALLPRQQTLPNGNC